MDHAVHRRLIWQRLLESGKAQGRHLSLARLGGLCGSRPGIETECTKKSAHNRRPEFAQSALDRSESPSRLSGMSKSVQRFCAYIPL